MTSSPPEIRTEISGPYIGEIELLKQNGMQWSEVITSTLEKQVKGRYLKIICTSGHGASHLGVIAEITVQKK